MMKRRSVAVLLVAFLAGSLLATELVVTDRYELSFDGQTPSLKHKSRTVTIKNGDADPDDPDEPDDPDPPTGMYGLVKQGADAINEPGPAEAFAASYGIIRQQIEQGTAKSKAKVVQAQKMANNVVITRSKKPTQWRALLDRMWALYDQMEQDGKVVGVRDMIPIWKDIERGFKESADARWELIAKESAVTLPSGKRVLVSEPVVAGPSENLTPEQWQQLIQAIIQIILLLFGGLG